MAMTSTRYENRGPTLSRQSAPLDHGSNWARLPRTTWNPNYLERLRLQNLAESGQPVQIWQTFHPTGNVAERRFSGDGHLFFHPLLAQPMRLNAPAGGAGKTLWKSTRLPESLWRRLARSSLSVVSPRNTFVASPLTAYVRTDSSNNVNRCLVRSRPQPILVRRDVAAPFLVKVTASVDGLVGDLRIVGHPEQPTASATTCPCRASQNSEALDPWAANSRTAVPTTSSRAPNAPV